jgi:hypothetical protein
MPEDFRVAQQLVSPIKSMGVVNLSVADRADGREGSAGPVGDARSASCGQAGDFVPDPEAVAHLGAVLGGRQQVATGPEVR